jgi:hypothetical protein
MEESSDIHGQVSILVIRMHRNAITDRQNCHRLGCEVGTGEAAYVYCAHLHTAVSKSRIEGRSLYGTLPGGCSPTGSERKDCLQRLAVPARRQRRGGGIEGKDEWAALLQVAPISGMRRHTVFNRTVGNKMDGIES